MILNSFDIAQNIRLVRETKGLTIEKLAELAGVSANHMSKVENGLRNLSMESYLNVLQALDVYPVFVAGADDGKETKKYISDFMEIIKDLHEAGNTIVLITHDKNVADQAQRKVYVHDGILTESEVRT